jgi:hypothetical protein
MAQKIRDSKKDNTFFATKSPKLQSSPKLLVEIWSFGVLVAYFVSCRIYFESLILFFITSQVSVARKLSSI